MLLSNLSARCHCGHSCAYFYEPRLTFHSPQYFTKVIKTRACFCNFQSAFNNLPHSLYTSFHKQSERFKVDTNEPGFIPSTLKLPTSAAVMAPQVSSCLQLALFLFALVGEHIQLCSAQGPSASPATNTSSPTPAAAPATAPATSGSGLPSQCSGPSTAYLPANSSTVRW